MSSASLSLSSAVLDRLDARLDDISQASRSSSQQAVVSVWLGDVEGRCLWQRLASAPHYAASTMKLPLVIAAMRLVATGRLDLSDQVPVHNRFASVVDGSVFHLDEADDQDPQTWAALGGTRTVGQLAEHAIVHSGNLATNLLIDVVGLDRVTVVLADAGCSPTTVVGRGIEDAVARAAGVTNTVTAADLGTVMAAVARRDPALGGESVCRPVEQILSRQEHVNQIPAGLPAGVPTASKSGWVTGVSHDVCLVRPGGMPAFVLSVCTTVDLDEDSGAELVASVARDVWAALTEGAPA